ncbi:uncharacterized protein LOC132389264 [Hypanus sabinus]|uniref:uncharacterized protein LOC132389264 n=1 Tax=Hypanus sabinus TaxID=79690 RepID=UPI0028C3B1A8|nr:uncharacterized protein LOC132389264 [Hypanus sabinus]
METSRLRGGLLRFRKSVAQPYGQYGGWTTESEQMNFATHLKPSDLREITNSYRDRLEDSAVEYILALSTAFRRDNIINSEEHERVMYLFNKKRKKEACKLLFGKVRTNGDNEVRNFWEIMERHQKINATLNALINEIKRTGRCGLIRNMADDHDTELKESTENEEDTVDNEKPRAADDKHPAGTERAMEDIEITNQDPATDRRDEKSGTSQDGRTIGEVKEHHETGNDLDRNQQQHMAVKEDGVDSSKSGGPEDDHSADNEGRCGVIRNMADDHDTELKESTENEEDTVDNEKPRAAEDKHGAGNERAMEDIEITNQDPATDRRDEKSGTSQDGRTVGEVKEHHETGNDLDRNQQQHMAVKEDGVDSSKSGGPEDVHSADNEAAGRYGVIRNMAEDHDTELKENTENEEDTVDNEKTRAAEDKHGASTERAWEDIEITNQVSGTDRPDEKSDISQDGRTTGELCGVIRHMADTELKESTENEEDSVDNEKPRAAEDKHGAGNERAREDIEITNQDPATDRRDEKSGTSQDGRTIGVIERIHAGNSAFEMQAESRVVETAMN